MKDHGRIRCASACSGVDHKNPRGGFVSGDWNGLQVILPYTPASLQFGAGAFAADAPGWLKSLATAGCYITSAQRCRPWPTFNSARATVACQEIWCDTTIPTVIIPWEKSTAAWDVERVFVRAGLEFGSLVRGKLPKPNTLDAVELPHDCDVLAYAGFFLRNWSH